MVRYLGVRTPTYQVGWAIKRPVLRRGPAIPEWYIFKGDVVQVLHGRDAGKQGVVRFAIPHWKKVVIEGLNIIRKHTRASKERPCGIMNILAQTRIEDLALVDPITR